MGPQQIITTTTRQNRQPTVRRWCSQGCWLETSFTKSEKKIKQRSSGATGTVPFALRSRGQCALESPMSWLRVARTCPQSAARTTGRRAIHSVLERMNGREAEACNRIFSNRGNLTRAKRQLYQLQLYCWKFLLYCSTNSYSCKKKKRFRVRRSRFADRSAGAAEPRRH